MRSCGRTLSVDFAEVGPYLGAGWNLKIKGRLWKAILVVTMSFVSVLSKMSWMEQALQLSILLDGHISRPKAFPIPNLMVSSMPVSLPFYILHNLLTLYALSEYHIISSAYSIIHSKYSPNLPNRSCAPSMCVPVINQLMHRQYPPPQSRSLIPALALVILSIYSKTPITNTATTTATASTRQSLLFSLTRYYLPRKLVSTLGSRAIMQDIIITHAPLQN